MRLGLCCGPSEGPAALAAGYDYVEYPAAANEPSETTNLFFPPDVRLYEEGLKRGIPIVEAAAGRGVRVMVLGSGGVRRAPAGMDDAEARFVEIAAELDRFARTLGLRVAPESLNPAETNVGTSLPDLARALAASGAPYTADSYHALVETGSPEADLAFWREQIPLAPLHVHFAPLDRSVPRGDEPSLRSFFARLRELGYDGRASLECRRDGIPDPAPLRRLFV
jgi:D-psicose/D-tagatose/L-ribulose 3-epimerase